MRIRFSDMIAGPRSARRGAFPGLVALASRAETLGPGRLHGVSNVLFTVTWPAGSTQGEVSVYGSDDGVTKTSAALLTIPWSAAGQSDQGRFIGSQQFLITECTQAVNGAATGATVTAQGNE